MTSSRSSEWTHLTARDQLQDAFEGALLGACIGDALGAPTELLPRHEILRQWGSGVWTFTSPDRSPFAAGRQPGQITDDAAQTLALGEAIVAVGGLVTPQVVVDGLFRWADGNPELFERFAGPTTRAAIERLRAGAEPAPAPPAPARQCGEGATNGLAMRSAPIGLLHAGDPAATVASAVESAPPTHPTDVAAASAAAIAAAVAEATGEQATPLRTVRAARRAARTALDIEDPRLRAMAAPSLVQRIDLAVSLAAAAPDVETATDRIAEQVGSGLHACEAVPAALGLLVAADGNPAEVLAHAAAIGDDTDTVACMAGAVVGALRGRSGLPGALVDGVLDANPIDPLRLAGNLLTLAVPAHAGAATDERPVP